MKSFLIIPLAAMLVVAVADDPCGNSPSQTYDSLVDVFEQVVDTDYDNVQPSCISKACPQLNQVSTCPVNSDKSINPDVVSQLLSATVNCFSTVSSICKIPINVYNFPGFSVPIPTPSGNITFCITNNDAQRNNMGNTSFSIIPSQSNSLTINYQVSNPNLYYHGNVTIQVGNNVQTIPLFGTIAFNYTIEVDVSSENPTYKIISSSISPTIPTSQTNISEFGTIASALLSSIAASDLNTNLYNFFGAFLVGILENAQSNCKPN